MKYKILQAYRPSQSMNNDDYMLILNTIGRAAFQCLRCDDRSCDISDQSNAASILMKKITIMKWRIK